MSNNEPEKKKGFLKGLFSKKEEYEDDIEDVEADDYADQGDSDTDLASSPFDPIDAQIHIADGALKQLWERWKGPLLPLSLSLLGNGHGCEPEYDKQEFTRERVRIAAQLERDAAKRLRAMVEADRENGKPVKPEGKVYIAKDGMAAWMILFPGSAPEEDTEFDLEIITKAMIEANVSTGIDSSVVNYMLQSKPYFVLIPFAKGTKVIEGTDGSVVELLPRKLSSEVQLDENGLADYRAKNYVQLIKQGDIICDIIAPVPGVAGVRVDGKVVEPKKVRPAAIPSGSNTAVTEDGLHLVSLKDGHLEYMMQSFHVKPLLDIMGDVDYSTGNIDYHGDVHIHGDVRENFIVHATGTIIVDGLVEAANVEAGGDLLISSGILGDNRAIIKSRGIIRAKYLENCIAYAGKAVYADCSIGSQVFSDGLIDVTSGRGTIIGGRLTAAYTVKARMIGSQSSRKTEIVLGVFPYVQEELLSDEEDLENIHKEMTELDKHIAYLEENEGLDGSSAKLAKAHLRRSVLSMKESKILKRRENVELQTPDLTKCRFECSMIYPATQLTIGDATNYFSNIDNHYIATFDTKTGMIKRV